MNWIARLSALSLSVLAGLALAAEPGAASPEITAPLLPGEPTPEDLVRAREILTKWETEAAEPGARKMHVVYWTPADRDPQPEYRARLTRVLRHIQAFYRTQMTAYGFPGRTIQLDLADDGLLRLPVAKGTLLSADCSEQDGSDGQAIRRDCLRTLREAGIDGEQETMVIFCNLAEWDPEARTMSHHSPYYASGHSGGGTAWQVDSPLLDPDFLPVKDQFLRDRQYGNISLGRYNSIFVGGACHELGHALGLPHCRECEAAQSRGTALMGSGNRTYGDELRGDGKGSFLTLPHALKLAAHPQFSGSVKQLRTPAAVTFSGWALTPSAEGLRIQGKLESALPVHAVLAYGDPEGGGDYDAAIAAAVPLPDGSFSLLLPPAVKARPGPALLSIVGVCANGAATASVWSQQAFSVPCRIDDSGGYDISGVLEAMEKRGSR